LTVQQILAGLAMVKSSSDGWQALCPAHDDHKPSLAISEKQGKILLHCRAGCTTSAVVAAMNIQMSDLFLNPKKQGPIARYAYVDESGGLLYEVIRSSPKAFRQRRPNGNGQWIWNLDGVRRVLYGLPELMVAAEVLVVEGEKDVETARHLGFTATCNSGGAGKWRDEFSEFLRGKQLTIIADADEPGRRHAQAVANSLIGKASSLKVLELPNGKDLTEFIDGGGDRNQVLEYVRSTPEWKPAERPAESSSGLRVVSAAELLGLNLKPRGMILRAFLPSQGLVMLYSKRGVGKTFISLGMAIAVASGGKFLSWEAPSPRRVLYLDGEMPGSVFQQRLGSIIAGSATTPGDSNLRIITPDLQDRGLPDLASTTGQELVERYLDGVELLVIDNLSALVRATKENEGEGWVPLQDWALSLRRRGVSVLFVHHAGKSGAQRGTSRREDLLDSVISLKHPNNYSPSDGLRCEVHYEKTRSFFGEDAKPFEVRMTTGSRGEALWTVSNFEDGAEIRVAELLDLGMSVRDIAEETGISKSKVHRLKRARHYGPNVTSNVSQAREGEAL
jgi:hypothetical protein